MLKKIVRLLLSKFYSKRESDAVARCAMPSGTTTIISSDSGNTSGYEHRVNFIAPVTGYVTQEVGNTMGLEDCFSIVSNQTAGIVAQCNSYLKNTNRVTLPCSQGDTILCTRPSIVPASEVMIKVSTAIGQVISSEGGGKILKMFFHDRRVCVCLKRFLLSCWKNLSTQNVFGLQKRPFQRQLRAQSTSLQRSQVNGSASRPPFLGTFVSELGPRTCCSAMGTYGRAQIIMPLLIKATHCLATRAARSRIRYRSMPVRYTFSLPRTWQIQCDLKGGALC